MTPSTITEQTMSSREIAELTGKLHKNVLRDVESMLDTLKIDRLKSERIYKDTMNRDQKEYLLNKELTLTLVTGYDVARRYALVKRWQELEEQAAAPAIDYANPAHAMKFIEAQAKSLTEMSEKLAAQANVIDKMTNTEETFTPTDAAKQLKTTRDKLLEHMRNRNNKWLYKHRYSGGVEKGPWLPYQPRINAGHLVYVSVTDKRGMAHKQVRITSKGIVSLGVQIEKQRIKKELEGK